MSESSGQNVRDLVRYETCSALLNDETEECDFEGNVDVLVDMEVRAASWECPRCNTHHDATEEFFA